MKHDTSTDSTIPPRPPARGRAAREAQHRARAEDRVIDALYDGVTDPSAWQSALASLAALVDAEGACMYLRTPGNRPDAALFHGYDQAWMEHFLDVWAADDPWSRALFALGPTRGRFMSSDDLVPLRDWLSTAVFNEAFRDRDIRHASGAHIARADGYSIEIGLQRNGRAGVFDPDAMHRLDRFLPHIERALRLAGEVDGTAALLGQAESERKAATFVVDNGLRVLSYNARGARLLEALPLLVDALGQLCVQPRTRLLEVRALVRDLIDGGGAHAPVVAWTTDPDPRPLILSVRAVPAGGAFRYRSVKRAALRITHPERPAELPAELLRNQFGLTATESRIARAIASGRTPDQVAAGLECTAATVRWHLKRIYAKTGTSGQVALTALLQSLAHSLPHA